jgi:segregation and condensation protein B
MLRGPDHRRRADRLPGNVALPAAYRLVAESAATERTADPLAREAVLAQVEAVLFAADEPLPPRKIAEAAGIAEVAEVRGLVKKLRSLYEADGSAFQIEELAGGFQLLTRRELHRWLAGARRAVLDFRLSSPARETLAIIAYRQPITRADIESIRGVHCGDVLRLLLERNLVRIAGRHDSLGRPVLYGTTKRFLQVFGLRSLKDLPRQGSV